MNEVVDSPVETLIANLREIAPALRAEGVTRLALFGSRARGDARPDSDLDILVDTTARGDSPPFDFFKVLHLIEDATGLRAQISMRELLKPRIIERIADDVIEVF
jgi:predicted nucleotidyltransferase